ncbi:DEAD/DEAH box helicase [Pseudarthrobacter sp. C4D7]|uniref:DEAD/DEAH box helicase n=1 Tax=Pseudarthrobacter sp. C4D7 TaxID=2735268 RepID=UPI001584E007|nr:DEAD/DEAH box helicase [Pseudarthrobacter sp. C4D7]NUT72344.1 DEAD/DEAH box helicase [Pseudarthrobacter sp. C4D7]
MSELLPTIQAGDLRRGLSDYLATTFALTDGNAQSAIKGFLADPENGLYKGSYVRLRLPFESAPPGWRDCLDWYEGFEPYGHQARAFQRLSSKAIGSNAATARRRPEPTLVTTGTGSGKTEAFLYPILDHVLRAKRDGATGMKALILYPMNALANDQAKRLAEMLTTYSELAGVTAGIYTGQQDTNRTKVAKDGLINDRQVFRENPPDVLLTNYKMLDMLLLRQEDAPLWQKSATSLQYVVLDEFHTYDGAQGTDVAMLLRRLGLSLKGYWPEHLVNRPDGLTEEDRARPLGRVTPVATSATLGSKGDPAAMLRFAETVFGEAFPPETVVTESRLSSEAWSAMGSGRVQAKDLHAVALSLSETNTAVAALRQSGAGPEIVIEPVLDSLFEQRPRDLLDAMRTHPLTAALLDHATAAVELAKLSQRIFPPHDLPEGVSASDAEEFLSHVIGLLSHIRARHGREAITVETHLWIREMSRVDAAVDTVPRFRWSDDGIDQSNDMFLPAVYCRHCGRSGWGAVLAPTGMDLELDDSKIREERLANNPRFRTLISAAAEADIIEFGQDGVEQVQGLHWLHTVNRGLSKTPPAADSADLAEGRVIPVLMLTGQDADDQSKRDVCPSCLAKEGIAFMGSAIATMLSVSISNLFGAEGLDEGEKKALVFTDSVQDAAHRAGYVQSRSHTMTLRTALRRALTENTATLSEVVEAAITNAKTPAERYQLVAPEYVDRQSFRQFWNPKATPAEQARGRRFARRRLQFDALLELGLQSRTGRTLELTGSLAVETDAGNATRMLAVARRAYDSAQHQTMAGDTPPTDQQLLQWIRGTVERVRLQGGINHEWLKGYIATDGKRWQIWGGRPKGEGMPAFPSGRPAPAFPRIGRADAATDNLDTVTPSTSWYSRWTARCLGIAPSDSGYLSKALIIALEDDGVLGKTSTNSGADVYWLDPAKIMLSVPAVDDLESGRHVLACKVCKAVTPGSLTVIDQLDGAPCTLVRCSGRLERQAGDARNFYRDLYSSRESKRVVAREHTSLLDDKTRILYETQFKSGSDNPQAPNVLVATPTLEMGIDIGDLSCVMLASLPTSVASYLQRVGRAGRLTGNSLVLAFVRGRGEHLPKLHDPLSVINGEVRPPATYLDAEEILGRQYVAHVADRFARTAGRPHPRDAVQALGSVAPGSFIGDLIQDGTMNAKGYLTEFLGQFGEKVSEGSRQRLIAWASEHDDGEPSGLARHLVRAAGEWKADIDELEARRKEIDKALPELEAAAKEAERLEDKSSDAVQALRTAKATLRMIGDQLKQLRADYWISVLEAYGVLPNYTLLDDSVCLDVGLSWKDADTQEFVTDTVTYNRGASVALSEFAPGATFYAQGMEILIDAVDLGPQQSHIQKWQVCPQCGWIKTDVGTSAPVTSCIRCTTAAIADMGQIFDVVVMKKVSAEVRRDEAAINDRRDNRVRERFTIAAAADIDQQHLQKRWFVEGYEFGAEYFNRVDIRWINTGRTASNGGVRTIAGDDVRTPMFRLCSYCGQLDQSAKENRPNEHRFWCKFRKETQESIKEVVLARELNTQGVVLHLPLDVTYGDDFSVPSLQAALLMGLQKVLGGAPDHLGVLRINDPAHGGGRIALMLHDKVPGGTGYLAEFADSKRVWELLHAAWEIVRDCSCRFEERLACHHCLLPHAEPWQVDKVARASAERLLGLLLRSGQKPADGEVPPSFADWTVTEEAPSAQTSIESLLEKRFRKAWMDRLKAVGAHTKITPDALADTITFRIPGQDFQWQLLPQVDIAGTRPDFLLKGPPDPNFPVLAIYTDGFAFHASPEHNRIADDAEKRDKLRHTSALSSAVIPWAVTWEDVNAFEAGPSAPVTLPSWANGKLNAQLMAKFPVDASIMGVLGRDAMSMLWQWVNKPDPEAWTKFSELVPLMLMQEKPQPSEADAVYGHAVALARGEGPPLPTGSVPAWTCRSGSDGFAAAGSPNSLSTIAVGLCLDDRQDALASPSHEASWRLWLQLSNLLAFKPIGLTIGSVASNVSAGGSVTAEVARQQMADEVGPAWRPLLDQATEFEKTLLLQLATAGLDVLPELGYEVDGMPVSIAWPDHHLAVVFDGDEREGLEASGWTTVGIDVDEIRELLKVKGA